MFAFFKLAVDHDADLMASALSLVNGPSGEPVAVESDGETVLYRVACDG